MTDESVLELQKILKSLYTISGFRISVYDAQFREIAAYPQELGCFCRLVQTNPKAKDCCVASDRNAFRKVQQDGHTIIYRCDFGLYEAVAPVFSFGVLTGYLMMGQTLDARPGSREQVKKQAARYISPGEKLDQVVDRISVADREKIQACVDVMRVCAQYFTLTNRLKLEGKDLAHEIRKYIDQQFGQRITIEALCGQFFCSRTTLITAFKKKYGIGINQYLLSVRVKNGCALLSGTDRSVCEISAQCGFSNQNYFSKVIVKETSMTPTEYRKAAQTEAQKNDKEEGEEDPSVLMAE